MSVDIGGRLRFIRARQKLSQRELAKRSGVTNSTISLIESNQMNPSVGALKRILDGIPMGFAFRPFYAWYGDMDLAPHLWQAFRLGGMTVEVEFHPPVTIDGFGSRKALAEHCQRVIADGVARAISGRPAVPAAATEATPTATVPTAASA